MIYRFDCEQDGRPGHLLLSLPLLNELRHHIPVDFNPVSSSYVGYSSGLEDDVSLRSLAEIYLLQRLEDAAFVDYLDLYIRTIRHIRPLDDNKRCH